jgi:hypothetical protein
MPAFTSTMGKNTIDKKIKGCQTFIIMLSLETTEMQKLSPQEE